MTAPEFARALDAALARGRPPLVDLTQVDYIDGRGLRLLLQAAARMPLTVRPSRLVRRLLEVVDPERRVRLAE